MGDLEVIKKNSFSSLTVHQKMSNRIQPIAKHWDLLPGTGDTNINTASKSCPKAPGATET